MKAQQKHKELPLIECELKQIYQEFSMRVTKVADSPIFCDKTKITSLFIRQNISQSMYKSICHPRVSN